MFIIIPFILVLCQVVKGWVNTPSSHLVTRNPVLLYNSVEVIPDDDDGDDDDEIDVGIMRVSEIKAELKLRGIDFSDCFDRESLAQKLRLARTRGRADPSIIDRFNRQRFDDSISGTTPDINDQNIQNVVAGDGTLPGGMHPDVFKKLMSNPELMVLLQNSKMQEVMKLMMTGGQQSIERAMREDPEIYELVNKLNQIMQQAL